MAFLSISFAPCCAIRFGGTNMRRKWVIVKHEKTDEISYRTATIKRCIKSCPYISEAHYTYETPYPNLYSFFYPICILEDDIIKQLFCPKLQGN